MRRHLILASVSTLILVGCSEPKPPAPTPPPPSAVSETKEVPMPVEPAPVTTAEASKPLPVEEPAPATPPISTPKAGPSLEKSPVAQPTEPAEPPQPNSGRAVGNALKRAFGVGP